MSVQAYSGDEKLVFAIDCGTTMSAVSFTHLLHGVVPQVRVVTRWPFQEDAAGNCKVPTAVRYDGSRSAVAFGTEALENPDGLENTTLIRYFKLLLHPKEMRDINAILVPPLPPDVSILQVYSDFLGFLYQHAVDFFRQSTLGGSSLWERLGTTVELALAIPNGWDESQQKFIRRAIVEANILPLSSASDRVSFVPEAEASVHFAVEHMNVAHLLSAGSVFAVLDAGGSTVDTTIYRCESIAPKVRLVEVTSSECVQAGSIFVDQEFEHNVRVQLAGSTFSTNEYVDDIVRIFENKTKRRFTGSEKRTIIQFGKNADNDEKCGIKMGRLAISNLIMRKSFQRTIASIVSSIFRLLQRSPAKCKTILLVGGFAESPYLRSALQEGLQDRGIEFVFSDEPTTKAAAEGACSWHVKQYVMARAARRTFGVVVKRNYQPWLKIHRERSHNMYTDAAGDLVLPGFLDVLVKKNDIIKSSESIVHSFYVVFEREPRNLGSWTDIILASDEENVGPWAEDCDGEYTSGIQVACTLKADLSGLQGNVERHVNRFGSPYWQVGFDIEVRFGGTSLTATISWKEKGQRKTGPVAVIPDSVF